ncbi:MAG: sigma-54-dependent Fis family transcriptional regulator [Candidatus Aminicenantes bacterium]|nr:sigma-54-dependent Fis family transcriptional regulator [Candidatus Aminicenantes bacterium]
MRILLVDDEELSRNSIYDFLKVQLSLDVHEFDNVTSALTAYSEKPFDIIISDLKMPGIDGLEFLDRIKQMDSGKMTDFILITGYGNMDSAIKALRSGAFDYLHKPLNIDELNEVIKRSMDHLSLLHENREFRTNLNRIVRTEQIKYKERCQEIHNTYVKLAGYGEIGIFSPHMNKIREQCEILYKDRNVPVLIDGETGTGKEIVARMVHTGNTVNKTPFIPLNCSAIPHSLFESELFGYDAGAFTDSKKTGNIGKFELANEGTLFLDEIGDLPQTLQAKLLRVIEEKEFFKLGGIKKVKVDVRIICATNKDLRKLVKEGKFRNDLYFRLNTANITLMPLNKRKDEILPLAEMFMNKFSITKNKNFSSITPGAEKILKEYPWPGNIRELHNVVERIILLYDEENISEEHLGFLDDVTSPSDLHTLFDPENMKLPEEKLDLKKLEREIVMKAMEKFDGNKSKAAEYLGLTRSALRSKLV